jgi:hypothetical protein
VILARRGEVWQVDLGMVAKVRPALIMSVPAGDDDRALVTVVPHTTSLRHSAFEIVVPVSFPSARRIRCPEPDHDSARQVDPQFGTAQSTATRSGRGWRA